MEAGGRKSEATSVKQADERVMRAHERVDERLARCRTYRFLSLVSKVLLVFENGLRLANSSFFVPCKETQSKKVRTSRLSRSQFSFIIAPQKMT